MKRIILFFFTCIIALSGFFYFLCFKDEEITEVISRGKKIIFRSKEIVSRGKDDIHVQDTDDEDVIGPRITDNEFFDSLDLENVELSKVKSAIGNGDILAAKREFVKYIYDRRNPKWHFDWAEKPVPEECPTNPDLTNANRYARNVVDSIGIWHDLGPYLDWKANPTSNDEWTWQLNRHSFWLTLGSAYWDTGDEKYARAFIYQMTDWIKDNPVPLTVDNNAGSSWRTIEAGIRMWDSWLPAFYYFLSSPSLKDEEIITMVKSFVEHANYLMKFQGHGNWYIGEADGLYHVGVMFPEFKEAEEWRNTAIKRLSKALSIQIYPDGVQYELTPQYQSINQFVQPFRIAKLNGYNTPHEFLTKLELMYNYMLYASMPDGYLPALNDSGYVNARSFLEDGFDLFPHRLDFLWLATAGNRGELPTENSYIFPYAGQLIMRTGWDSNARYLFFDVGPFGHGHQHEDKLNFTIHAYGENLLIDPGNYAYDESEMRRHIVSSYAHNVIHVDGKDQHRRGLDSNRYVVKEPNPFKWKSTENFDYASAGFGFLPEEGFGDGRDKTVSHTRHILFVKNYFTKKQENTENDYWLVVDKLEPNDKDPHTYESMFHLDVERVTIDSNTNLVLTKNYQSANLAIIPVIDENLSVKIIRGQKEPFLQGWMPINENDNYRVRPLPTAVFKKTDKGTSFFVYVFYPLQKEEVLPVNSVKLVDFCSDKIQVKVTFRDGHEDELQVGHEPFVKRMKRIFSE